MPIKVTLESGNAQFEAAKRYFLKISDEATKKARVCLNPPPRIPNILGKARDKVRLSIKQVRACNGSVEEIENALYDLPHHLESSQDLTFFLEGVDPIFTGCILHNHLAYVNAMGFHFARLDDHMYGMALQGRGSYLLEITDQH